MTQRTFPDLFLFPHRLVYRAGAAGDVGELLAQTGVAAGPVLVVADQAVHRVGLTSTLLDGLTAAGYRTTIFADVAGEPELEMISRAMALLDGEPAAVVGIGGGSALDTAKLLAYLSVRGGDPASLRGVVPELAGFPSLVCVPTTVGTGSEATRIAMYSQQGAKRAVSCAQFVPSLAVLDPDLVVGLPDHVVAATALDALSHAVESMMSTAHNRLTWLVSVEAARSILRHLEPAVVRHDEAARGELLYASFLSGMALNAGVVLGHSLSYVLSQRFGLAHGVGCALALPYCLAYNQTMADPAGGSVAEEVLSEPGSDLYDLAVAITDLERRVGLPTSLERLGMGPGEEDELGARVAAEYPRPTNPVELVDPRLAELVSYMALGDLKGAWQAMKEDA